MSETPTLARARVLAERIRLAEDQQTLLDIADEIEREAVIEQPLQQQIALLTAGQEPGVWPCGCRVRMDRDGVSELLTNEANPPCDHHGPLQQQIATLRENEGTMLRKLSDALSGGNAGTWDEIVHAAEQAEAALRRAEQEHGERINKTFQQGMHAAQSSEECPYDEDSLAAHWWTRGYAYAVRNLRAIVAEAALRESRARVEQLEQERDD